MTAPRRAAAIFNKPRKSETIGTSNSTNPVDYQNCIKAGGKVTNNLAPSYCELDGKKYSDGNF